MNSFNAATRAMEIFTSTHVYFGGNQLRNASTIWDTEKLEISNDVYFPAEEEYATLYEAPVEVVILLSIFYGGISIIAVIGNTLVISIVATTRQMRTVTNMYIANLAFADVIIGMFCIPFQFQAALLQRWNLPDFMCAFCPFVQVLSVNVSVFTLTAIAVDRHRAIINPLRARPTRFISKVIISSIWIAAISFAVPIAIAFRVIEITEKIREGGIVRNVTRPFCENVNLTENQLQSYRYYLVLVQYVIPFCIISFVYIQMAVRLWGSRTPGNAQDARDVTLLRNKKKVIKMLIIVVVVFGVCWFPLQSYNILHVTWPAVNEYRFINIIWFCCDWLAMSNSCYNPFIYGIYNEKFKREFNKRFTVCFCKFRTSENTERTMSIYTRASSIRSNYTNSSTRCRNNVIQAQHQHGKMPSEMGSGMVITEMANDSVTTRYHDVSKTSSEYNSECIELSNLNHQNQICVKTFPINRYNSIGLQRASRTVNFITNSDPINIHDSSSISCNNNNHNSNNNSNSNNNASVLNGVKPFTNIKGEYNFEEKKRNGNSKKSSAFWFHRPISNCKGGTNKSSSNLTKNNNSSNHKYKDYINGMDSDQPYIPTDCACRILNEGKGWDQERDCDGSCLIGPNDITSNDVNLKTVTKLFKSGNSQNGKNNPNNINSSSNSINIVRNYQYKLNSNNLKYSQSNSNIDKSQNNDDGDEIDVKNQQPFRLISNYGLFNDSLNINEEHDVLLKIRKQPETNKISLLEMNEIHHNSEIPLKADLETSLRFHNI